MADFTALKQSIAAAIRANGEGAITGPVLQDQLLDMVDAMEVDTFGGFLTADTVPPTDTTVPHVFIGYGEFTNEAFQIGVQRGEVWIVCRMADEEEWTKVNLTSNLLNRVQALEEGTQTKLTEGDGIDIDAEGNISTKIGTGLKYDNEGNMEVDTDTIATNASVEEYVSGQKNAANGIAGLDGDAKVDSEQLPNDVAYFAEESIDPDDPAYHDEYERVLAKMYQDLDNWDAMSSQIRQATTRANTAAGNAEAKGNQALTSSERAEYFATRAENMANAAEVAKNNANASAANADRAAENVSTAIAAANQSAARANTAADAASTAATEAQSAKVAANTAAGAAATAATNAQNKGNYAKNQGDAAKEIVDGSKGDYPSLNDRLNAIENGKQDTIEDLNDIREGAAAGATAYQVPVGGIPKGTLASSVQTSLGKADTAFQLPQTGIPQSDLAEAVQAKLDNGIGYVEGVDWSNM